MVSLFGVGYIGHPRLVKIIEKNKITDRDMLTGEEEAAAFENKEYVKLHQSTLRKGDILANLFERTADGTLKTNSKWYEIYGIHPKILVELVREHWAFGILGFIVLVGSLLRIFGVL